LQPAGQTAPGSGSKLIRSAPAQAVGPAAAPGDQTRVDGAAFDDPGVRPALHMFVGSKAAWWEIRDDLPQFEEWVPGYGPEDQR